MKIILCLFLSSLPLYAFVEVGGNYWYQKEVFGDQDQNISRTQNYGISAAWFLFNYTALEGYYNRTDEKIIDGNLVPVDSGLSISNTQSVIITRVYGFGIRQALAPRAAFMVPSVSLGIAKQFSKARTNYVFVTDAGENILLNVEDEEEEIDSSYASFSLRFNVTRFFGVTGAIRTVVPGTDFSLAKDNLRYNAGISWIF